MGISNSEIVALRSVNSNVKGYGEPTSFTRYLETSGWITITQSSGYWFATLTPKGRTVSMTSLSHDDDSDNWSSVLSFKVMNSGDIIWRECGNQEIQRIS